MTPANPVASSEPSPAAEEPPFLHQVLRFAVVGGFGFIADVGGFNLLRYAGGEGPLHDYPLTAKVLSGILATVVAWLGNRYWTFRHSRREKAHHEFILFAVVAGLGTLIAMSCLWISHYLLRLTSPLADNISANVIGLGLALVFRFWAYRRHVFSGHGDGSGLSEVAEHGHHHEGAAHPHAAGPTPTTQTPDADVAASSPTGTPASGVHDTGRS